MKYVWDRWVAWTTVRTVRVPTEGREKPRDLCCVCECPRPHDNKGHEFVMPEFMCYPEVVPYR